MANNGTGKPVPSEDVRDLLANATNLDVAINGEAEDWTDRLNQLRRSWAGFQKDFTTFVDSNRVYGFPTWEAAAAAVAAGQVPVQSEVNIVGDDGTHVDPVSGATVSNSGRFVMTAGGLEWRSADALAQKAEQSELHVTNDKVATLQAAAGMPGVFPLIEDFVELTLDVHGRPVRGVTEAGIRYTAIDGRWVREADPIETLTGAEHIIRNLVVTDSAKGPGIGADEYPQVDGYEVLVQDSDGRPVEGVTPVGVVYRPHGPAMVPVGNQGNVRGFTAWGDSTTYGADLVAPETERWTTLLAAMLQLPIDNYGVSGQRAEEIVARLGAIVCTGIVAGESVPASGSVQINGLYPALTRGSTTQAGWLVTSKGERLPGRVRRSTAGGGDSYFFDRTDAGAVIAARHIEFHSDSVAKRCHDVFLAAGINNESLITGAGGQTPSQTIDQLKGWLLAGFQACRGQCFVWSMLDRGYTERRGTPNGDLIAEISAWSELTFGSRFIDVRKYLASDRALNDALDINPAFAPTAADAEAVGAGTVPPSFRSSAGSVHLNAFGHQLQARCMYRHIRNFFGI